MPDPENMPSPPQGPPMELEERAGSFSLFGKDMRWAGTPQDIVEMRKQETRRRVTYGVVITYCFAGGFLLLWAPEMRSEVFTGMTGLTSAIIAFYFAGRQIGQ